MKVVNVLSSLPGPGVAESSPLPAASSTEPLVYVGVMLFVVVLFLVGSVLWARFKTDPS